MNTLELAPSGSTGTRPDTYEWPAEPGRSDSVQTEFGWSMSEFGPVPAPVKDLLRIVAAAYLADRSVSRPAQAWRRDLHLIVHAEQSDTWTADLLNQVADLLHWLSGDTWQITLKQAATGSAHTRAHTPVPAAETISLLSGGLDSLCGALLQLEHADSTVFLGHRDTSTAVRQAQDTIHTALRQRAGDVTYLRYAFRALTTVRERTLRTRSLLFMALAAAVACGRNANRILVPENGFTSINPPLEPSRGGPLTTRSTHPWTFHTLQQILVALPTGDLSISNPHATMTKGELVAAALRTDADDDLDLAAATVSCAKLSGGRLPGANPNLNCGLCIACLVRRGAFAAAPRPDRTRYLATTLTGASLDKLRHYRRHDIAATAYATSAGFDEYRVIASGLWPADTDFGSMLTLCARGLEELALVHL